MLYNHMRADPEPPPEDPLPDSEFVEVDPTGRYGRYDEVLGKGASKIVYKGFDKWQGLEVAWNQLKVADVCRKSDDFERFQSEIHLLQTLKHKNIIKFYRSWVDTKRGNINFITEVFTSGTLRQYRKKHKHVDLRALKNWSRQILSGLDYLHSHDPPVIHRDLKCDNIFVNGNHGELKIGDLGLAAVLHRAHSAHSVIGTPEFMAPELYEEEYNELVDIYAFGMCLLELVTFEYPYMECANAAQIYKKVILGMKPASLAKVKDPEVKQFIEKCIGKVSERLSARELLLDPFLQSVADNGSVGHSVKATFNQEDNGGSQNACSSHMQERTDPVLTGLDFTVEGQRKDINTIFLKLRIADSTGQVRNIHFPFDIEADTSISVATEMVAELDLSDQDVTAIAAMIDSEIRMHVPEWTTEDALDDNDENDVGDPESFDTEADEEPSSLPGSSGNLVLERLPSGRKYWSDSPRGNSTGSLSVHSSSPKLSSFLNSNATDDIQVDLNEGLASTSYDSQKLEENHGREVSCCSGDYQMEERSYRQKVNDISNLSLSETVPEDVKCIMHKLEDLLFEQQKELYELKKKHDMALEDLLKELPPDLRNRALEMSHFKKCGDKLGNKIGVSVDLRS